METTPPIPSPFEVLGFPFEVLGLRGFVFVLALGGHPPKKRRRERGDDKRELGLGGKKIERDSWGKSLGRGISKKVGPLRQEGFVFLL